MTEQEWLACEDPQPMLTFLSNKISDRKLRLFVAGHSRCLWHLLNPDSREAVETAERFADGRATIQELQLSENRAGTRAEDEEDIGQNLRNQTSAQGLSSDQEWDLLLQGTDQCDRVNAASMAHAATLPELGTFIAVPMGFSGHYEVAVRVLLCIIGNPFHPTTVNASSLTSTVTSLATAIYDDRAFDRMPILADALEDAGCTNQDILDHCRQPGEHCRGCWVVDLLLGKE
jgi:hypothetical protein